MTRPPPARRRRARSRRRVRAGPLAVGAFVVLGMAIIPAASVGLFGSLESAFDDARAVAEVVSEAGLDDSDRATRSELRRVAIDHAEALSRGDTSVIPPELKSRLREHLGPDNVARLRTWFREERPSAEAIRRMAHEAD
ncbi:MAG: hypothetical protein KDC38_05765 [Planctomycetes bacterium]|nr:hypothetical protein [Planctomycetota bacterium]